MPSGVRGSSTNAVNVEIKETEDHHFATANKLADSGKDYTYNLKPLGKMLCGNKLFRQCQCIAHGLLTNFKRKYIKNCEGSEKPYLQTKSAC